MSKKAIRLYENEGFQTAANEALRPGGLELTKKAMKIAGFAEGSHILDIGSGCGKTVEYLTDVLGMQSSGIDISEHLAVKAKRLNSNLEVVIGDVCRLPYADASMNGVICECVFNLLEDRTLALAQMHRVLAQRGKLIISDLYLRDKKGEFSGLPIATCINGITTRENTIQEVTAAGFQLIEWQDETQVYKEFVAGLIIKYGSMGIFWESLVGSCDKACSIQNELRNVRIGYYLSVWKKSQVDK
ncbi:MAG: DVU_1556 family methyltransferase [Dehalococcoidia bacterium]